MYKSSSGTVYHADVQAARPVIENCQCPRLGPVEQLEIIALYPVIEDLFSHLHGIRRIQLRQLKSVLFTDGHDQTIAIISIRPAAAELEYLAEIFIKIIHYANLIPSCLSPGKPPKRVSFSLSRQLERIR